MFTAKIDKDFDFRQCRYRLYVDESGDHTFNLLDDPAHRYLSLLGVWFRQADHYLSFVEDLEKFKRGIFGPRPDNPVILHRSEIINRKGPFGLLCDQELRKEFDSGILNIIRRANFRMFCIVIDKKNHIEKYANPFHPYHYCLAIMMERYCGWLSYKNSVGDVMAESRGREEDLQLKQAYHSVYQSGTRGLDYARYQTTLTSKDIKLKPKSSNIAGLQLADILAHPVKQAMLLEKNFIKDFGDTFGQKIYDIAKTKFNSHEKNKKIDGYGKKWM